MQKVFIYFLVLITLILSSCTVETILVTADVDSVHVELLGDYAVEEIGAWGAGVHYIAVDSSVIMLMPQIA
jgi:hypothetical protein